MFREMFLVTGLAKLREKDAAAVDADEVLHMATVGGAKAMGLRAVSYTHLSIGRTQEAELDWNYSLPALLFSLVFDGALLCNVISWLAVGGEPPSGDRWAVCQQRCSSVSYTHLDVYKRQGNC